MKKLIAEVGPHQRLYRDATGIAWVENGQTGTGHSAHANISATGSVRGMKARGYWPPNASTVRSHGFIYNVSDLVIHDPLDRIAAEHCECKGCIDMDPRARLAVLRRFDERQQAAP